MRTQHLDPVVMRAESIRAAKDLGYSISELLPLNEPAFATRTLEDILRRALVLYCVVALANGADSKVVIHWLETHQLLTYASRAERQWLESPQKTNLAQYLAQEEALWAIVWALGFQPTLNFSKYCEPTLAQMFPRVSQSEAPGNFCSKAQLRTGESIYRTFDLAYCLHWAIRDAQLRGQLIAGAVEPYAIVERRRALQWMISAEDWDELSLDT